MARIRTMKPEFYSNEKLSSVSLAAHFLAGALLNYADDEGYFNANPKLIAGSCVPLREEYGTPTVSVPVLLRELSSVGYLELGIGADGRTYGHIINFRTHQVINKAKVSKIKVLEIAWGEYGTDTVPIPDEYRQEQGTGNREQGTGKKILLVGSEAVGVPPQPTPTTPPKRKKTPPMGYTPAFEQAWGEYPKRSGDNPKQAAYKAWCKRISEGADPIAMIDGVRRYRRWCDTTGKTGTETVKMAQTFFGPNEAWKEAWDIPKETRQPAFDQPVRPALTRVLG